MAEKPTKSDEASLNVLVRGAEKTFDNAERLFHEAELLANAGAVARALCLHQISLEECSKVNTLGVWAVSLVLGFEVNQKKILSNLTRHAAKNNSNAYMLEASEAEKEARLRDDWRGARAEFERIQKMFHQTSNTAKNASLYVDWVDGDFVAPSEQITEEMLAQLIDRNAHFLSCAYNTLKMVKRLEVSPDETRDLLLGFVEQLKSLNEDKSDNTTRVIKTFLSSIIDTGRQKSKG